MSFVYFRLPHTTQVYRNRLNNEPEEIASLAELNGRRGFVIAPFDKSDQCPILLLDAEWEPVDIADDCKQEAHLIDADYEAERDRYAIDFENFHAQLRDETFQKIVLARSARLKTTEHIPALSLFARACNKYPRLFVALFSTKRSGTWLIATPEILVSGKCGNMQTMALAGTMRLSGSQLGFDVSGSGIGKDDIHWSTKNIQEQRYVETYITECIEHYTSDFSVFGPYTSRAGDLVHLRSDISFCLNDTAHIGNLLNALHPTPAVCGMPKADTRDFITHNESAPRDYYSGFAGTLDPDGDTNLFVTLRCMKIDGQDNTQSDQYTLYAGGGLLKDSTCQSEWEETEAKMNTMRQTFKL
ncbi:isochorismate synthase [Prevotella sp.]|uniref:isochorismate synthase n=1 Tax=Prevotella sp. TaxID=59823 RepID=UPI0027E38C0E|nr:isochorismate synthase [Prevotella sp.]